MNNFEILKRKLEAFIRKFYLNELLKGLIYFTAIGLLYFLVTLFIEYLLWLSPLWRTILFWSFVLVEVFLFSRFIVFPLLKLFKISRGIDHHQAALIIGKHFPEVSDKLLNVLQLKSAGHQTELLLAGIEQKSDDLKPVPFSLAINFRKNLPLLKYAAIPVMIILAVYFTGKAEIFASSYERVVNYKVAYEPPAPFAFHLINEDLKVKQNESLTLEIRTLGKLIPQSASIHFDGQEFFLNPVKPGLFQYTFEQVSKPIDFNLSANGVSSPVFSIAMLEVPRVQNLEMQLNFPPHTNLPAQTIEGTGNATVPEGTSVKWIIETRSTEKVSFKSPDTVQKFSRSNSSFSFQKALMKDLPYQISTSNRSISNHEKLSYRIKVVQDELPVLELEHKKDSLDTELHYFRGKVTDDYGISKVRMVVQALEDPENQIIRNIPSGRGTIGEFFTAFPDTLRLERGKEYEYYFQVFDNDAVNGYKSVKSKTFFFRKKTIDEEEKERLQQQHNAIEGIDGSLKNFKESEEELKELNRLRKEKKELNYNDRKKLEDFLTRQKQQNEVMKNFSEKLKTTLEKEERTQNPELKKQLEERLESREEELQKNEELLKELEKYTEKMQEEGLSPKLEELSKRAKNDQKNLKQLLELTKRFYVQEKIGQVSNELQKLGEEQEKLSEDESSGAPEQDSLNQQTEEVMEDLQELKKENEALQKPMDNLGDSPKEQEIREEQEKASEDLKQGQKQNAKEKQKKAGEKMKELAQKMQRQNQSGNMEQMSEDADMLRKILDNLITFSFKQEEVMKQFQDMRGNSPKFSAELRRQNVLKENFRHIDDSLYALGRRNPMINETINKKISDVDFNIEKSLERFAQNELLQGVGSQQYVVTGANDLALLLSNILNQMEQMMSAASGRGGGKGMQLPDIIKKQEELNKEMQQGTQKQEQQGQGQKGQQGEGEEGMGELFEIFKQQQMLRRALEEELKKEGDGGVSGDLMKEMEEIEKDLLEKGYDRQTLEKMQQLEHKLLDLEEALTEEGQKEERESKANVNSFDHPSKNQIIRAKEYFRSTEILNRQTLPLRQHYKQKVKEYFDRTDH